MKVLRIVPDLHADRPAEVANFYRSLFGLEMPMDQGWIVTLAADSEQSPQLSIMREGGSGTPVPDLSIEVDDLEQAIDRARALNLKFEHGPVEEPWNVRRFFVRDPEGRLINVLQHMS